MASKRHNNSKTIWPISRKFGMLRHIGPSDPTGHKNLNFKS